ncbi:MAG: 30S ribosomal protein S6 [Clostridia bacterium]|nr:30S ribosomal protein S6 [Clostridia bacterium]MBQ1435597.1 30S ribosomal protein S6 [Clostridia bacterium]MBQ4249923.1 30S ribosomal protein S6 [Clostridia bacterium]
MEKKLVSYETIFIVDMTGGEEAVAAAVDKFKAIIEKSATVESVDEWGKRRLAYPINDLTEGYYVLVNFQSEPEFPKELDRLYNINDAILRSIIIRKDA